jgi:T-complex protein 1 subunit theta
MGDATNLVLILGGELLKKAENLLIMGLHPSEVIKGYELASAKAQAELESTLSCLSYTAPSTSNHDEYSLPFRFYFLFEPLPSFPAFIVFISIFFEMQ